MPSTNQINRELVKAFNSVLLFDETFITNLTVEEDHIVLSFDKNMNIDQRREYLINMRESIVEKFCGSESAANDLFYTDSFPFNFNQGKWTTDSSKHRFSVPIEKEVVRNLKYLLANALVQFTTNVIMESYSDQDYVDDNTREVSFDRKSYLYCIRFKNRELQNSLVNSFSSKVKSYKNGPKKTKDFLEEKGSDVYIKKSFFDNPQFIKDIVMDKVSLTYRNLEMSRDENETVKILKFAVVDLICKALPHLPTNSTWNSSHKESKDEYSILAPIVDCGDHVKFLNEKEVDYINKIFGMDVLSNMEDYIDESVLSKLELSGEGIYAIDFANPDISYCVMDKIIESSVINKDDKLSIDPARVPVMQLPPKTLAPSVVERDGASGDSGLGDSPKGHTIHAKNSSKFLSPSYGNDEQEMKGGTSKSFEDSAYFSTESSNKRNDKSRSKSSASNQPGSSVDNPSVKLASNDKKNNCCIS